MVRGKQWTAQEETELKALVEANTKLPDIAIKLQKTPGAIIVKSQRLGLRLQTQGYVDSSIPLPRDLPSVEQVLKILAGALKTATKPGLNKIEVQRLLAVAMIAKNYKEFAADFVNYRDIETNLRKMEEITNQIGVKTENDATQRDPNQVA